jgi:hypothetical protein
MKEETHDVEDMEQDELDEEDSEDEGPWIEERLIDRINKEIVQKERRSWKIIQSWAFDIGAFSTSRDYIFAYSLLHIEWLQTGSLDNNL